MFSLIGRMMDRTHVNFGEKERFTDLKKQYSKALSHSGMAFCFILLVLGSLLMVWYKGQRPTPALFYVIPPASAAPAPSVESSSASNQLNASAQILETALSPRLSTARAQSWVKRSLIEMHNLSFVGPQSYEVVVPRSRLAFREDTYQQYLQNMNGSDGLIPQIQDKSLIVTLAPNSEVRVIAQTESEDELRVWKVEMDGMLIKVGSIEGGRVMTPVMFRLVVEEVPSTVSPYGLVISQYTMEGGS